MRRAFAAFTLAVAVAAGGTLAGLGLAGSHAEDGGIAVRAFAPQLACDDCKGTPGPSPTITATATTPASATASATATKTTTPKPSPTPSPKPSLTPSPSPGFSPAPSAPPQPSPTVAIPACEDADAHIVSLDRETKMLRIEGHGSLGPTGTAEMGWWLRNENDGFHRYTFKPGFILNGFVDVVGGNGPDSPTKVYAPELYWLSPKAAVSLYDCRSVLRQTWHEP